MMIALAPIAIICFCLWSSVRRLGTFSPISVYMLIWTIGVFTYWMSKDAPHIYTWAGDTYSNFNHTFQSISLQAIPIILVPYLFCFGTKFNRFTRSKDDGMLDISNYLKELKKSQRFPVVICTVLILVYVGHFIHASEIDWTILWKNHQYGTTKGAHSIGITSPFGRIYHQFIRPLTMLIGIIIILLHRLKKYDLMYFFTPLFAYGLLFILADVTRFGAMLFGILTVFNYFVRKGKITFATLILITISMLTYLAAILGRSRGIYGVSQIGENISLAAQNIDTFFEIFFYNVFCGPLILFKASQMADLFYPFKYTLLSFSPLPSSIDGFRSVLDQQHRINRTVPFNAYSEALHFPFIFQILFCLIIGYSYRIATLTYLQTNRIVGVVITFLFTYNSFRLTQYPIRNSFREMFLFTLIAFFVLMKTRKRIKKNRTPLTHTRSSS